jgi:hypothetical protein
LRFIFICSLGFFGGEAAAGVGHCVETFAFAELVLMAGGAVGVDAAFGEEVGAAAGEDEGAPAEPVWNVSMEGGLGCGGWLGEGRGGYQVDFNWELLVRWRKRGWRGWLTVFMMLGLVWRCWSGGMGSFFEV